MSKSRNLTIFDATEDGPKFLTLDAKTAFNCLWLAFIEAPILQYFYLECYICMKNDVSGFAISQMLSQLTFGINPDRIVTKIDLGQWHQVAFFSRKIILVKT